MCHLRAAGKSFHVHVLTCLARDAKPITAGVFPSNQLSLAKLSLAKPGYKKRSHADVLNQSCSNMPKAGCKCKDGRRCCRCSDDGICQSRTCRKCSARQQDSPSSTPSDPNATSTSDGSLSMNLSLSSSGMASLLEDPMIQQVMNCDVGNIVVPSPPTEGELFNEKKHITNNI